MNLRKILPNEVDTKKDLFIILKLCCFMETTTQLYNKNALKTSSEEFNLLKKEFCTTLNEVKSNYNKLNTKEFSDSIISIACAEKNDLIEHLEKLQAFISDIIAGDIDGT